MKEDFRPAIRRALQKPCTFDFVGMLHTYPAPDPRFARAVASHQCTRTAFKRVLDIIEIGRSGILPNATHLAKRFSTSLKTINRDVKFLREELGAKITYDRHCFLFRTEAFEQLLPSARAEAHTPAK